MIVDQETRPIADQGWEGGSSDIDLTRGVVDVRGTWPRSQNSEVGVVESSYGKGRGN